MQKNSGIKSLGLFVFIWIFGGIWVYGTPEAASPTQSVIGIRASVPATARTSQILGTERNGSGIVIDHKGLIVTIGYLILEAKAVEIIDHNQETLPATIVAYDIHSGLGLIRALAPLDVQPLPLGQSAKLSEKDPAVVINSKGVAAKVFVGSRQAFAGSWEYLLDEAIFTVPAVSNFSGAALLDTSGHLVGIGSLFLRDYGMQQKIDVPSNLFVPIDTLTKVMADLLKHGRPPGPSRPWLGINVVSYHGHVMVQRVTPAGPADFAGINEGDIILAVNGQSIDNLEMLFKTVWKTGQAGTMVPLQVLQRHLVRDVKIISEDRYNHYQFSHSY